MAVDRDKRSVAANKLGGFIAISLCVLSTCVLQLVAISDLDQPPISVTTFLGESASFNCSIREGDNILWYVDGVVALSLPQEYDVSFVYERGSSRNPQCILSTLQIQAINNSLIQCAVAVNGRLNLTYFPSAHLLVQGPPMPPPDVQITVVRTDLLIIDLTWEQPASLITNSITNYTVRLNVSFSNETSEHLFLYHEIITTETSLEYNISHHGIHLCVVTVDVLAQNKVGTGEAARKTVLSNIDSELCTSSSVVVAPSSVLLRTIIPSPALHPGLKAVSPTANMNRMLIYGGIGGVLVVLLLIMITSVIIVSTHLILRRRKNRGGESANEEPKTIVSYNEAYAIVSVDLHKQEEVHIYEEPSNAAQNRGAVITTRNEAYASWTMQHSNQPQF